MKKLLILALLSGACATNPVTGKRELALMTEAQEISTGQEMDVEVRREMGVYEDEALQKYVSDIGLRLARNSERPNLPWHFAVVDVPAVNAFALPGGYIYITRGILALLEDEAQLAGVLGHEIGHVTARHAVQQYSQATGAQLGLILGSIFVPAARPLGQIAETGLGILFLKYGRDDELQADQLGVRYAARSGWEPGGVAGMLSTLGRIDAATDNKGVPNWLSTHPAPEDRVQRVQAEIAAARKTETAPAQAVNREEYLRRIDGMVYGDNPEQGIVRGHTFLHPNMRFSVDFPDGWEVVNSQTQVAAREPGLDPFMVLQLVPKPSGRNLEEVALSSMQSAGFRAVSGSQTTINGLNAFVATYQGTSEDVGRVGVRAAHISHDSNVFVLAGLAPTEQFDRAEPVFTRSLRSFRPLKPGEAEDIRPNRIDFYTTRDGDTWQSIAERQGRGVVMAATLAIMNGRAVNEQPRPGERIKIVVAG